ncbi:MAG: hypothetical protein K9H26_15540 [Prolixibacteraceae bacterium]|nr:hypothetical protein [Prolixibacteraceae bacterium]
MKLEQIVGYIDGSIICGNIEGKDIEKGFCSDLMSDVLTIDTDKVILITGMANMQTIRTSEMADIHTIIMARNKKATPEMIQLACDSDITLIETPFSAFRICGILYSRGLKPVY